MNSTQSDRNTGTWPIGLDARGRARSITVPVNSNGRPLINRRRALQRLGPHHKNRCIDLLREAFTTSKRAPFEIQQIADDGTTLWVVGVKDRARALYVRDCMMGDLNICSTNAKGRRVGAYIVVED